MVVQFLEKVKLSEKMGQAELVSDRCCFQLCPQGVANKSRVPESVRKSIFNGYKTTVLEIVM